MNKIIGQIRVSRKCQVNLYKSASYSMATANRLVHYVDLHNHIQKLEVVDPLTPTHLDKLIKKAINRREKLLLP